MKLQLSAMVLSVTCMTASALEPGRYLISAYRTGTAYPASITPNEVHRGYLLTVPKDGLPKLEVATPSIKAGVKIDGIKIEYVRITNGEREGSFTLEAKFIESEPAGGRDLTHLLNLSFGSDGEPGAGSEINVTEGDTSLLLARIGRLPDAEKQDALPTDDKAAVKDQPSTPTPK